MVNENHILFSGYARLPSGTVSGQIYRVMALVVLIDRQTDVIIDADCTLSTPMSAQFVARLLVGKSLRNGPENLTQLIEKFYQGSAKKAIITAIRIIYDKYLAYITR